jgi:glycosyltransferase involved in cell wall biosynthesis
MRIAFLASRASVHTVRWVNEMTNRGHEVHLITMHSETSTLRSSILYYCPLHSAVHFYLLRFKPFIGYYLNALNVRRLLYKIKPDLLHTHYASGYGTLARLSGFHPNLLSVYGADVFDFPGQSRWKMHTIRKNLASADQIASTSVIMKRQTKQLCKPRREIAIIPFGVNVSCFRRLDSAPVSHLFTIGAVKSLYPMYGLACLIKAFALALNNGLSQAQLIITGGGPQEKSLKALARKLEIDPYVKFLGPIPHEEVPKILNSFDVYAALSEFDESFGVSIIEASSCELPVIVSNMGGLPEVVENGKTGFLIPAGDVAAAANKIVLLFKDASLRKKMGIAGRDFVVRNYDWKENADRMEKLYSEVKHIS